MAVPYTFGTATASIPLSNLDSNFATTITLGNTAIQLGNTVTTLNNMTLANVTVSSGNVTFTNVSATLANVTTANIGTAVITGTSTLTGLTASTALALDASKNIVSVTNTGTGNNVLATSPTITTPTISSLSSAAATALTLQSAGTTAVTVDTSQNVGIGTTSPTRKFEVYSASALYAKLNSATTGQVALEIVNGGGNFYVGIDTSTGGAFGAGAYGRILYSEGAYPMVFFTNGTERMRIDSSGNLLVGTTSALQSSKFSVSGSGNVGDFRTSSASGYPVVCENRATGSTNMIVFLSGPSEITVGSITYNSTTGLTVYATTSDYRAKDISGPVTDSGALIDSVPVYMGKMKGATQERPMFIAHETPNYAHIGEKDAVDADGNPVYQQMDASALIPVMWAEIQSLRIRLAALEAA